MQGSISGRKNSIHFESLTTAWLFLLFLSFLGIPSKWVPSVFGGKAIDRTFLLASLGGNERRRRASSEPPTTLNNRPFNLLLIVYVP